MKVPEEIGARLIKLEDVERTYLAYAQQRLDERDFHGLWDVAINLAELSNERDGLQLAAAACRAIVDPTSTTIVSTWKPAWGEPIGHDPGRL